MSKPAALIDLDGTLVDTNYQHTLAWYRAFRKHGLVLPIWRIHRAIGMGGDQLVEAVAGKRWDEEHGDAARADEPGFFHELVEETEPLEGARDLLVALKERGHTVVLARSAQEEDLEHYLGVLDAEDIVDAWTTSADVERTKPEPDIIHAALAKAHADAAVMIGDTGWDIEAAQRAGVKTIAVMTGGWSEQELRDAGAVAVFESLVDLREGLGETPLS